MKFKKSIVVTALPAVIAATSLATAQAAPLGQPQFRFGAEQPSTAFTADRQAPATLFNVAETKPSADKAPKATPEGTPKATPKTTPKTGSKAKSEAQRRAEQAKRAEAARNQQRIEAAKPLEETSVPIKQIIGADVRNKKYAQVATVEDLKLKNGKIAEVVISTGGFLGMGSDYYLVSMDKVRIHASKDATFLLIDVDKSTIQQFAEVEEKDDQWVPVTKQTATDKPKTKPDAKPAPKVPEATPKEGQTDREMKAPEPTEKKDGEKKQ